MGRSIGVHVGDGHLDLTHDLEAGAQPLCDVLKGDGVHVAAQGLQHGAQHLREEVGLDVSVELL